MIDPATLQPEAFFVDAGATKACGFELSGAWQPAIFDNQLYADENLTCTHAEPDDGFGVNPAASLLAASPEWLVTGGVTWAPTEGLAANMSARYTAERYADFAEGALRPGNVMESYFL
ncbi:MAG: hypothetical protein WEA77_05805 [Hyphomonas sp.]|uniref:hypothetical protein n=1 Tax=Hyphomonas sp. TaxID=87 RepID=UPI0034A028FF